MTESARDFHLRTKENALDVLLSILAFTGNTTKQLCGGKIRVEEIGSWHNSKDVTEIVPSWNLLDPDFQPTIGKGKGNEVIREAAEAGNRDLIKQGLRERKCRGLLGFGNIRE